MGSVCSMGKLNRDTIHIMGRVEYDSTRVHHSTQNNKQLKKPTVDKGGLLYCGDRFSKFNMKLESNYLKHSAWNRESKHIHTNTQNYLTLKQ
jgi:hypothetical protein